MPSVTKIKHPEVMKCPIKYEECLCITCEWNSEFQYHNRPEECQLKRWFKSPCDCNMPTAQCDGYEISEISKEMVTNANTNRNN